MEFNLDDIQEHNEILPPRIVLYSPAGVGKTTFGARAINPVIAQTEKGLGNLVGVKKLPFIDSYAKMVAAINLMFGDHPFKTFVLDTADWLEPLIWQQVCQEHAGKTSIEDFDYGKGYTFAAEKWVEILDGLTALQEQQGMNIIVLAHAEIKRFDSPEVEPYDQYRPKLHKKAAEKLFEWADICLFGNFKTIVRSTDVGFNKEAKRGESTGQRLLYAEGRPAFYAKNRFQLPPVLPFPKDEAHKMIVDHVLGIAAAQAAQQDPEQSEQQEAKQGTPAIKTPGRERF